MCSKIRVSLRRGLCGVSLSLFFLIATSASDVATILSQLEHDPVATADRLLELPAEANPSQATISAYIQTARTVGRQGHWKKSIALFERARQGHYEHVSQQPVRTQDAIAFLHTIDLAIASAAGQCQEFDRVILHSRSVLDNEQAPAQLCVAAYPMLIEGYRVNHSRDEAIQALQKAIQDERAKEAIPQLADLAIKIGNECLQQKELSLASRAYNEYLSLVPDGPKAVDAKLGIAWAAALGGEPPLAAAALLTEFVDQFPEHRDAAHALRASATCFDQANDTTAAETTRQRLLGSYPASEAASGVLSRYLSIDGPWPAPARSAWTTKLEAKDNAAFAMDADQLLAVFGEAFRSGDDPLWQAGVHYLVTVDADGKKTAALLTQATSTEREPLAEHLAVDLISLAGSTSPQSASAVESACRWAGASERWSLLALAAEELGCPDGTFERSLVIDRILAESLMQTQRPAEAMLWWDWLIEHREASDFSTLLRGAETSVAHGSIETATARIDSAKASAGDDQFKQALISLLSAELSIRRARFDEARESLTSVVRANDSSTSLRPRAQWLIGETYFMQQRYADAIDAYRRVDAMDSAGEWAPAALLQAGKAFEKLGRGRDAAVCYTALLTRFRDWPHATLAQSRLATLNPTTGSNEPVLR